VGHEGVLFAGGDDDEADSQRVTTHFRGEAFNRSRTDLSPRIRHFNSPDERRIPPPLWSFTSSRACRLMENGDGDRQGRYCSPCRI
jgi:hypothetical protein